MKKILVLIGMASLLFSSCTWKVGVYDDSIPEEKAARLCWDNLGNITEYNGITVDWKSTIIYQIPPGDTLLQIEMRIVAFDTIYRGAIVPFKYNFQPHITYMLCGGFSESDLTLGIYVYAFNRDNEFFYGKPKIYPGHSYYDERHKYLVEFVPLLIDGKERRIF
jgi:hypothetical protein